MNVSERASPQRDAFGKGSHRVQAEVISPGGDEKRTTSTCAAFICSGLVVNILLR